MRPFEAAKDNEEQSLENRTGPVKVLFISEQLSFPEEILPYIEALLQVPQSELVVTFRFRPSGDGFRDWVTKYKPGYFERKGVKISSRGLQEAIMESDVLVGSHSTAILESLFQYKVPILFHTQKWGDYLDLESYGAGHPFFAKNPEELIERVRIARSNSIESLNHLRVRFFGNPKKNGSEWVVNQLQKNIQLHQHRQNM